uniref:Uncharacterized protein n=1 Tax=Strongyloides stercoralis TaxID=6248 RepID=A0AAF5DTD7_STRER
MSELSDVEDEKLKIPKNFYNIKEKYFSIEEISKKPLNNILKNKKEILLGLSNVENKEIEILKSIINIKEEYIPVEDNSSTSSINISNNKKRNISRLSYFEDEKESKNDFIIKEEYISDNEKEKTLKDVLNIEEEECYSIGENLTTPLNNTSNNKEGNVQRLSSVINVKKRTSKVVVNVKEGYVPVEEDLTTHLNNNLNNKEKNSSELYNVKNETSLSKDIMVEKEYFKMLEDLKKDKRSIEDFAKEYLIFDNF